MLDNIACEFVDRLFQHMISETFNRGRRARDLADFVVDNIIWRDFEALAFAVENTTVSELQNRCSASSRILRHPLYASFEVNDML